MDSLPPDIPSPKLSRNKAALLLAELQINSQLTLTKCATAALDCLL